MNTYRSKALPLLATVGILAGHAKASLPAPQQGQQDSTVLRYRPSRPDVRTDFSNGLIIVPYEKAPAFLQRTSAGLQASAQVLRRMGKLAKQASTGNLNTAMRLPLSEKYEADRSLLSEIVKEAHFEGSRLFTPNQKALLKGRKQFDFCVPLDLPSLSSCSLFPLGQTGLLFGSGASVALRDVTNALTLIRQSRFDLVEVRHQLDGQAPSAIPNPADLQVPFHLLPTFAQATQRGMLSTQRRLIRMRELAEQATDGTLNTSMRAGLNFAFVRQVGALDTEAKSYAIDGFVLFDGAGDANLRGPLGAGILLPIDLPDLTRSGLALGFPSLRDPTTALAAKQTVDASIISLTQWRQRFVHEVQSLRP